MTQSQDSKRERKDHTTLKAWTVGHDLIVQTDTFLQEYRDDPRLKPWCDELLITLRDSIVQVIEGYYKRDTADKWRRYEAAGFYIEKARYTVKLGQDLGWWHLEEWLTNSEAYLNLVRATSYYLYKDLHPKVSDKSKQEAT